MLAVFTLLVATGEKQWSSSAESVLMLGGMFTMGKQAWTCDCCGWPKVLPGMSTESNRYRPLWCSSAVCGIGLDAKKKF